MNYIKLRSWRPFSVQCLYVDVSGCYYADSLFEKYHLHKVKYEYEGRKPDDKYCVCVCRILRKDFPKFQAAMMDLPNKLAILGYRDYEEYCQNLFRLLYDEDETQEKEW